MTKDASRQGHTYEPAQAMAVKALAEKLNLGHRATLGLFEDRPDLCRVVGFPPIPSRRWFAYTLNDPPA